MTDTIYVLDASAILAAFFDETGADRVADRMPGALVSAVNYHEVVAKLVDRGSPLADILDIMGQLDVEVVAVDRAQAAAGGLLRAGTRAAGLSLGDRSCLALAKARKATAVTADKAWQDLDLEVAIEIIR